MAVRAMSNAVPAGRRQPRMVASSWDPILTGAPGVGIPVRQVDSSALLTPGSHGGEKIACPPGGRTVDASARAPVAQGRTAQPVGTLVLAADPPSRPSAFATRNRAAGGPPMSMHKRLRRHVEECLGADGESPPGLRRLLRRIEREYRRADELRTRLRHALGLLSGLLQNPRTTRSAPAPAQAPAQ